MRIYRNGNNTGRVLYEHAVLNALKAKAAALPFEVPHALVKRPHASSAHDALRHMKDHDHATFTILKSGAAACVFKLIPGGAPTVAHAQAIGMATAQLVKALADVVIPPAIKPVNPMYVDRAHHTHHQHHTTPLTINSNRSQP